VKEGTAKYMKFIQNMQDIIDKIGTESPFTALNTLKGIVDEGSTVLNAVGDDYSKR